MIDYDNKAPKGDLISLNKYIQGNKYLIDINAILCEHIKSILDLLRNNCYKKEEGHFA